jgi:hypothetical protein
VEDIRKQVNQEIIHLYQNNYIFRTCIERALHGEDSYERGLELACLAFAKIQKDYDKLLLDKIMNEPIKLPFDIGVGGVDWKRLNGIEDK